MGFIAFGLAMPFAVVSAWLRNLLPTTWIYLHVYGNLISLCCTVIAVITAVSLVETDHFTEPHHIIGLILLLFTSVQVWFGLFRPAREMGENNDNTFSHWSTMTKRVKWFIMHRFFGIIILIFGIYQVRCGLIIFAEEFGTEDQSFVFSLFVTISTIVVGGVWTLTQVKKRAMETSDFDELNPTHPPATEGEVFHDTQSSMEPELT